MCLLHGTVRCPRMEYIVAQQKVCPEALSTIPDCEREQIARLLIDKCDSHSTVKIKNDSWLGAISTDLIDFIYPGTKMRHADKYVSS
jgi:hypothetical protein